MTKRIKRIAMLTIATVAIGVASLTSCTKDDEVINDVPAMEEVNGSKDRLMFNPYYLYWRYYQEVNANGDTVLVRVCDSHLYDPYHYTPACGISIDMPDPDVAVAHMETTDGRIDRLVLYSSAMDKNLKNMFLDLVGIGKITFSVDCPITDPASLEVLNQNSIPAGEYSIIKNGEDFVIIIAE